MVFIDLKKTLENFKGSVDKEFKRKTTTAEIVVAIFVISLVISASAGYYLGYITQTPCEELSTTVQRAETYMSLYKDFYGKPNVTDREFTTFFKYMVQNIPNKMYDENLTVNELISVYESYKPPSRAVLSVLLDDICGNR